MIKGNSLTQRKFFIQCASYIGINDIENTLLLNKVIIIKIKKTNICFSFKHIKV